MRKIYFFHPISPNYNLLLSKCHKFVTICPNLFLASGVITGIKSQAAFWSKTWNPHARLQTSNSSLSAPLEATKVSLLVQLWGRAESVCINIMNHLFLSQEAAGRPSWLTARPPLHPHKLVCLEAGLGSGWFAWSHFLPRLQLQAARRRGRANLTETVWFIHELLHELNMHTTPGTPSAHTLWYTNTQAELHGGNREAKIKSKPVNTPTRDAAPLWVSQNRNKKNLL